MDTTAIQLFIMNVHKLSNVFKKNKNKNFS